MRALKIVWVCALWRGDITCRILSSGLSTSSAGPEPSATNRSFASNSSIKAVVCAAIPRAASCCRSIACCFCTTKLCHDRTMPTANNGTMARLKKTLIRRVLIE